ncbi:MFS transporter [Kineococcus rhizosphaerae]|uniref:Putative MFS family arabinose efflux permease n=1 Tax=Kineococcus rhizosphaerae TaxID=559628 RepID=A0A2T0RB63_9ACTN|nr:MFS transporter [Kineococcus rhizosphaerae]PRY18408.1 putative MFS family arabinose efflux permease [Kineococcus rhizosphaerae]
MHPAPPTAATTGPRRSRVAVVVLFVVAGAVMGGWSGRIPTVKADLGLSDAQWGLVALAMPLGSLVALLVLTRVIGRTGARALALPGAAALLVVAPLAAVSPSAGFLAPALALQGASTGLLFGPMNALAVDVERRYGRSIMSSFHAWFSVGQLTGGLAGAAAGLLGVDPWLQLTVCDVALAVALCSTASAVPRPHAAQLTGQRTGQRTGPWTRPAPRERPTPQIVLLAALALLSAVTEGSAVQWSAQFSVSLGAGVATGSLTLVCYSLAIALTRSFGDRVVDRVGRRRFVQLSALTTAAGVVVAVGGGTVPAALLGFALVGLGCGCVFPTIMGLAGNQPDISPARAVTYVNLGEWPAFFLGPPLVGALAEVSSLRWAMGLLVVTALAVALLARRIRVP